MTMDLGTRRVALYARVSTAEQRTDSQLDTLRAYARARGFGVTTEFVDAGASGAKRRRPALDRLLAEVRGGRVDAVVCTKLDRLARSVRHLTQLAAELEALGVDLIVTEQAIDTSTTAGRLLFHVLGAVAEFERDTIRERVTAGLAAARRRGKHIGRPRALDRAQANRLRRMCKAGRSQRHMARVLGVSQGTVRREMMRLAPGKAPSNEASGAAPC